MVLSKLPPLGFQHRLLISLFARAAHLHNIPSFYLFRHAIKLLVICMLQLWKLVLLFFFIFSHV